jgi:GntR family transcriptional regulator
MTKSEYISKEIRGKIQNGTYAINMQIPTEKEFCNIYKVSRITIKKAIDQLVTEGLLAKRRGSGTFVKGLEEQKGKVVSQTNGLFNSIDKSKVKSTALVFEVIPAGKEIAAKLNIDENSFVYHIIRYRSDSKDWQVIDYVYMPIELIPGLNKDILQHSIYQYIEKDLGYTIQSAHRVLKAIRPNEYDKKYLHLKDTDPVLSIEQIGYLDDGAPFEFSEQHHIGDKFEFRTVSIR